MDLVESDFVIIDNAREVSSSPTEHQQGQQAMNRGEYLRGIVDMGRLVNPIRMEFIITSAPS